MSAALDLVLQELAAARRKHPTFARCDDETVTVMASEFGEYSSAILRADVEGPHGAIREAAQLAAVSIRAIEYWTGRPPAEDRTCSNCAHEPEGFICEAGHDCEGGHSGCVDWTPKGGEVDHAR